jgi:MYXO-CTERM domain-containing protein
MTHLYVRAACAAAILGVAGAAKADQVVQVPVDALLNARAVTTLTDGRLVPWTVGIDGGGLSDGYMTAAASKFHGDPATLKTLPDDGKFPADTRHPEVQLHFSNDALAASQQTHYVRGAGQFSFDVPAATYSKMFLFVTSSEGSSSLSVTLKYADTTDVVPVTVPDYYNDVSATDALVFNLASNLPKWTQQNAVAEMNHHNLTGLELHPRADKALTGIAIDKTAAGYFVFWGATGIASGLDVDSGVGAPDAPIADAAGEVGGDVVEAGGGGMAGGGGATATGAGGVGGTGGVGGATAGSGGGSTGAGGSFGIGGMSGAGAKSPPAASDAGCACSAAHAASSGSSFASVAVLLGALGRRRFSRSRKRSAPL